MQQNQELDVKKGSGCGFGLYSRFLIWGKTCSFRFYLSEVIVWVIVNQRGQPDQVGQWSVNMLQLILCARVSVCVWACRFSVWAVLFVLARLLTLSLSVLTVGFGLAGAEQQGLDLSEGNFNILFIRYNQSHLKTPLLPSIYTVLYAHSAHSTYPILCMQSLHSIHSSYSICISHIL